jgi:hypothetical protein
MRLPVGEHMADDAEAKVDELQRHNQPPLRFAHRITPPDPPFGISASTAREHSQQIRVTIRKRCSATSHFTPGRVEIMSDVLEAPSVWRVGLAQRPRLLKWNHAVSPWNDTAARLGSNSQAMPEQLLR